MIPLDVDMLNVSTLVFRILPLVRAILLACTGMALRDAPAAKMFTGTLVAG